jgi:hypothetical protein
MYIKHCRHLVFAVATLLPFSNLFAVLTSPKSTQNSSNTTTISNEKTGPLSPGNNNVSPEDDYGARPAFW